MTDVHPASGGDGPETVTELTIDDEGVWRVWTQGSSRILDLDRKTVTRVPGDDRARSINDTARALRTLDACRVGEPGRWTVRSDDSTTGFFWHVTSTIRKIERETARGESDAYDQ